MKSKYRSVLCGQLNENDEGKNVNLAGWVRRRRDHGGLIFLDLADYTGIVQLVASPEDSEIFKLFESVRSEYVISVSGLVRYRPDGTVNENMSSGRIEVMVKSGSLLSKSEPLPFMIDDVSEVKEEIRLKYRFLDLRRDEMQKMLRTRHGVYKATRRYLDKLGFCEVETPILSKPTPEGARDFLVPSRLQHGYFYALPQSPQLYKQVLMCASLDKYYQIVKCFRDEDFRANRQPEFTQIDIEMSFIEEQQVQDMVEGLVKEIWKETKNIELQTPFSRMDYDEVMLKYGVDAPDLRFELTIRDVSELFKKINSDRIQEVLGMGGVVRGILVPDGGSFSRSTLDSYTSLVAQYGAQGLAWFKMESGQLKGPLVKFFNEEDHAECIKAFGLEDGHIFLAVAAQKQVVCSALANLRLHLGRELELIDPNKLEFLWVESFPLLEYDSQENRYMAVHHPFTSPKLEELANLDIDPASVKARAYDLVLNGQEVGGGSIRIFDQSLQQKMFSLLGISEDEARTKFGFLLDALSFGAPPHGGIALGVDRITMILCGMDSIRDIMAFPKTQKGTDIMVGAPGKANLDQLLDLGIRVVSKVE